VMSALFMVNSWKVAGRNCPTLPGHGGAQAVRGQRRPPGRKRRRRAALDGENAVARWREQQDRLPRTSTYSGFR